MMNAMEEKRQDLREVRRCPGCGLPTIQMPVLQSDGLQGGARPLRAYCFHDGRSGLVIAECIDLDISAQGSTSEEAIGALQEAVFDYLRVAFSGDSMGLVLRPSPWTHRARYHLHRLRANLRELILRRHAERATAYQPRQVEGTTLSIAHCC